MSDMAGVEPDPLGRILLANIFDEVEYADLLEAAAERGIEPLLLVKAAVHDDLYR